MPPFRRVASDRAGPTALGFLVPPGPKTLVIVRPRALAWDLLPARWTGDPACAPVFCSFGRDEAAGVARRLQSLLEEKVREGSSPVQTVGDAAGRHFQVWVRMKEFVWIVCRRTPAQAYQPLLFGTQDEAHAAGKLIEMVVWPGGDAEQEFYFNTQKFV
jgi:hypothetical protein